MESEEQEKYIDAAGYGMVGAKQMQYKHYSEAMDSFAHAYDLYPSGLFRIFSGICAVASENSSEAYDIFSDVEKDDLYYLDAQYTMSLAKGRKYRRVVFERELLLQIMEEISHGDINERDLISFKIDQLMDYFKSDAPGMIEAYFKAHSRMNKEWEEQSPKTRDEVLSFYQNTDKFIFHLSWRRSDPDRRLLTKSALVASAGKQTVLDFGCGIGDDGIEFARKGFDVTISELPSKTFDYALYNIERSGYDIKTVVTDELKEQYDVILCFDVLEHVWEPEEMVTYLREHLNPGGLLLAKIAYGYSEKHPMHLARNDKHLNVVDLSGFALQSRDLRLYQKL